MKYIAGRFMNIIEGIGVVSVMVGVLELQSLFDLTPKISLKSSGKSATLFTIR